MKLLFVGDAPMVSTGFGQVSKNLLKGLSKHGYDISVLAINWFGDPYDRTEFPYDIWPCDKGPVEALFGYAKMWHVARQVKPDIIFFLNDPWVIEKYLSFKPSDFDTHAKYIAYFPIDSGPLKPEWAQMLTDKFDAQVCYSHFAENVIIDANKGKRPANLHQVYHGVDTREFFPIQQGMARAQLGLPQESFIVGMIARNQYRKRFDLLTKAFAEFAKDKPEAKLYLHTGLHDVGFDILDLARQFKLDDKLILTEDFRLPDGVPTFMLNLIYNSLDVHALISLGDGFGLPVAESMAVGCPQLVSDHSCLRELVEGHGGLTVKNAAWLLNVSGINTWGGLSDVDDIVVKLNLLYHNQPLRLKLTEDAYQFITQDKFKWGTITNQFNTIIREAAHVLPRSTTGASEGY